MRTFAANCARRLCSRSSRHAAAAAMVALTIVFGAVDSPKASVGASRERLAFTHTPTDRSRAPSASFAWTETLGAHYECSLDDGARRACSSPTGLLFLAAGRHTFVVSDGSAEIRFAWTVVGGAPATLTSRMQLLRLAPAGMVLSGRPGRAPGGPWYSVRQLPGHDAVAFGLDEKDDAVGFAHDGNYNYRGVVWRNGQAHAYGQAGSGGTIESIVNPSLFAGAAAVSADASHAMLYRNGSQIDLGTLGGMFSRAAGVSPDGTVVGNSRTGGDRDALRAFVWRQGVMRDALGDATPTGKWSTGAYSSANAINARDQIVGAALPTDSLFFQHPYVLTPRRGKPPTIVDVAAGLTVGDSEAFDIDDAGDVAGGLSTDSGYRAFVWQKGVLKILDALGPGSQSVAYGVNASDEVAGAVSDAGGRLFAAVWHNGQSVILDRLLPANSSASDGLFAATAINERGQLTASTSPFAGELKTFVLTPLTKLTSVALPSSATGGMTVRVTVQIDRPAPPGGVTVVLRRGSPGIDIPSLPSRLVIPAGSSSRTISLQLPSVRVRTNARIAASLYGSTAQATIVLLQHAA